MPKSPQTSVFYIRRGKNKTFAGHIIGGCLKSRPTFFKRAGGFLKGRIEPEVFKSPRRFLSGTAITARRCQTSGCAHSFLLEFGGQCEPYTSRHDNDGARMVIEMHNYYLHFSAHSTGTSLGLAFFYREKPSRRIVIEHCGATMLLTFPPSSKETRQMRTKIVYQRTFALRFPPPLVRKGGSSAPPLVSQNLHMVSPIGPQSPNLGLKPGQWRSPNSRRYFNFNWKILHTPPKREANLGNHEWEADFFGEENRQETPMREVPSILFYFWGCKPDPHFFGTTTCEILP